jgi:hypothetical protein
MGEAKIRKASDPSYGRAPKKHPSRGLIISTPIQIDTTDVPPFSVALGFGVRGLI